MAGPAGPIDNTGAGRNDWYVEAKLPAAAPGCRRAGCAVRGGCTNAGSVARAACACAKPPLAVAGRCERHGERGSESGRNPMCAPRLRMALSALWSVDCLERETGGMRGAPRAAPPPLMGCWGRIQIWVELDTFEVSVPLAATVVASAEGPIACPVDVVEPPALMTWRPAAGSVPLTGTGSPLVPFEPPPANGEVAHAKPKLVFIALRKPEAAAGPRGIRRRGRGAGC
jgi:hypothetical protein